MVFTGLSGSGKSSLAFDTIYAEGQKKYVESLSAYARQFLGLMKKPDVKVIEGLSPAISIDQKTTNKNPRSTVGTVTENLRLFETALCANRNSALSDLRPGDHQPICGQHCGSDCGTRNRNPADGTGPGNSRTKGRTQRGLRTNSERRLHPSSGGWRDAPPG